MSAEILSGKDVAAKIDEETRTKVADLAEAGVTPLLGLIRLGKKPGDLAYERGLKKKLDKLGVKVFVMELPEDASQDEIIRLLNVTNNHADISGIMIFRPLPPSVDEKAVAATVSSVKDVDGMNPVNVAKVFAGDETGFAPCTAEAAIDILEYNDFKIRGKKAAVAGRSLVIGKPVAAMLTNRDATVTVCHSKTEDLGAELRQADIVVAAIGKAGVITKDMIKPGAAVIDVGINVGEDGKLTGDVAKDAADVAGAITPVPGGVGSVTTSVLALHVAQAAEKLRNMSKARYTNKPAVNAASKEDQPAKPAGPDLSEPESAPEVREKTENPQTDTAE